MHIDDNFILKYKNFLYYRIKKEGIKHQDSIDDIFTEVVVRIMKTYKGFDPERGNILSWLLFQVKSVTSHYLEKRKRSKDMMIQGFSVGLEDADQKDTILKVVLEGSRVNKEEGSNLVQDLIDNSTLTTKQKEVLTYKIINHLTIEEIAEKRGVHERGVYAMYERAYGELLKGNVEEDIKGKSTGTKS